MQDSIIKQYKQKINKSLKEHGFIKHKSIYCRILNKSVYQSVGFVRANGSSSFTFESINLYAEEMDVKELSFMFKLHIGFNSLNLINYHGDKEYYFKNELIEIIAKNIDIIISKLDELNSLEQHIKYIEKRRLYLYGQPIKVPFEFYLYDEQFVKAKKTINDHIYTYKDCMVQSTIEGFVEKQRYESEDLSRELYYIHIKEYEDLLKRLNDNTYIPPNFNDIYNKNVLVLNEFFNCDFIKRFE